MGGASVLDEVLLREDNEGARPIDLARSAAGGGGGGLCAGGASDTELSLDRTECELFAPGDGLSAPQTDDNVSPSLDELLVLSPSVVWPVSEGTSRSLSFPLSLVRPRLVILLVRLSIPRALFSSMGVCAPDEGACTTSGILGLCADAADLAWLASLR